MAILSGIPLLSCQSIDKTLDFYQKILQFVIVKKRESENRISWVHLMHGQTTLMLQRASLDHSIASNKNISLYYFVNNIKEMHHFIKINYNNVTSIKLTDYQMQEFTLYDPEGNQIIVGESVNHNNSK